MKKVNINLIKKAYASAGRVVHAPNRSAMFTGDMLLLSLYNCRCVFNKNTLKIAIANPWPTRTTCDFLKDCLHVFANVKKGDLIVAPYDGYDAGVFYGADAFANALEYVKE